MLLRKLQSRRSGTGSNDLPAAQVITDDEDNDLTGSLYGSREGRVGGIGTSRRTPVDMIDVTILPWNFSTGGPEVDLGQGEHLYYTFSLGK